MGEENAENIQEGNDDGRPDWLPSGGEFSQINSPEELAKAYSGAVRKITETSQASAQQGQELESLRSQIEEIQAAQTQQTSQAYEHDIETQLYEAFESGDGRTAAAAAAFLANQAVEKALANYSPKESPLDPQITAQFADNALAAKYPDWQEVRSRAGEVVGQNPTLFPISANTKPSQVVEYLDAAYKLAKFENGESAASAATSNLEELARLTKQQAQTMSGTNSSQEAVSYWDDVKKARSGVPSFGV